MGAALVTGAGSATCVFWEVFGAQIAGALRASQARYYPRFLCLCEIHEANV
jgi:hypothetical protein